MPVACVEENDYDVRSVIDAVNNEFSLRYSDSAKDRVAELVSSSDLNGGEFEQEEGKNIYPGAHFSIPLSIYVMRRVMNDCDANEAYELYLDEAFALSEIWDSEIIEYPYQEFVENICADVISTLNSEGIVAGAIYDAIFSEGDYGGGFPSAE